MEGFGVILRRVLSREKSIYAALIVVDGPQKKLGNVRPKIVAYGKLGLGVDCEIYKKAIWETNLYCIYNGWRKYSIHT